MKTLLFIGLNFHKKTKSADFVLRMFEEQFQITHCYVDLENKKPYSVFSGIQRTDFDVVVCWQALPPREQLDSFFRYKHAVLFPMFDGCPSALKPEKWFAYRDFQIISFSKTLEHQLSAAGFSVKYIQYFPLQTREPEWGEKDSAFFWTRVEEINIPLIEDLCSRLGLKSMHIHKIPDPGCRFVPASDNSPIRYTYSTWYADREEMEKDIAACAYYVAPRQKEGIGMSFLEAMAMGRCVIAPDSPTMNEYIVNGQTGLLYNLEEPVSFPPVNVREIQQNTYHFMCAGQCQWEDQKRQICEWLEYPVQNSFFRMTCVMVRRFMQSPAKTIKVLWREFWRLRG